MTSMVQGTHLAEDPPARRRWTASTRHGHPGPTLGPEKEEIGSAQMPYATVNPYTNELVKSFPDATDEEVDAVLDRAQEAYRSSSARRNSPAWPPSRWASSTASPSARSRTTPPRCSPTSPRTPKACSVRSRSRTPTPTRR